MSLKPKSILLDAAVIKAKLPPMIVKKDTVIYNINHWQDNFDQSLESVLAKIPGFEILGNGELKVNGKNVDKVLIDGEEITDGGAALLTRNLSPDKVKAIELRMKEKNDKLKESLLSSKDLVVLDIKLKDDFNHSLFGRLTTTVGHQNQAFLGGNTRLFTLKEKTKFQLLAEKEDFGDRSFTLSQVQNIGEEAFNQIFEVPADINRLKKNPEFNKEVYGFKEYTSNKTKDLALTGKITLSPKAELFLGSYNSLEDVNTARNFNQTVLGDTSFNFNSKENQSFYTGFSKNKAEFVVDLKNTKLKYNFNAVFYDNRNTQNQDIKPNLFYNFNDKITSKEFYHNLFAERRLSENTGLHLDLLRSDVSRNIDRGMFHNNMNYATYWDTNAVNMPSQTINQDIKTNQARFMAKLYFQTQFKSHTLQVGLRYLDEILKGDKSLTLINKESQIKTDIFKYANQETHYSQFLPYLEYKTSIRGVRLSNRVGLSNNHFYDFTGLTKKKNNIFEWTSSADFSISEGNDFNLSYSQTTAAFPLYQLLSGSEITDFQTVIIPNRFSLTPQREQVVNFSSTIMALSNYGIALEFAFLTGKALNNPTFNFNNNAILESYNDQLPSNYYVAVNKIGKVFDNFPVQLKLESSIIGYTNYNRTQSQDLSTVSTNIKNLDFKAFSSFKDKNYNFDLGVKYTNFSFANSLSNNVRTQDMWNINFKYKHSLLSQKLLLTTNGRFTHFNNGGKAELFMLDADISYLFKKFRTFIQVQNLFDAKEYVMQEINPSFYSDIRRRIFTRYVKLGFTWDIN
ncbi:MAG: hypothetical protein HC817_02555 [Saprospiraceae bacterium]|nr:hypothetical protein [Saprospiraceae bacterium]